MARTFIVDASSKAGKATRTSSPRRPPAARRSRRWRPAPTTCFSSSTTSSSSWPPAAGPRSPRSATTPPPATPSAPASTRISPEARLLYAKGVAGLHRLPRRAHGPRLRRSAAPRPRSLLARIATLRRIPRRNFPMKAIHSRRLPPAVRRGPRALPRLRQGRADLRLPLPRAAGADRRRTTSSPTWRRSGSAATTTSGGRCGRTAWPSASARATRRRGRNSTPGSATVPHTPGQPALPLVPPRAEALFRDRRADQPGHGRTRSGTRANAQLPSLRVHDILAANNVAVICTTDDPADSLEAHERIRALGAEDARLSGLPARPGARGRTTRRPSTPGSSGWPAPRGRRAFAASTTSWAPSRRATTTSTRSGARLSDHGMETALAEPCTPRGGGGDLQGRAGRARRLAGRGGQVRLAS